MKVQVYQVCRDAEGQHVCVDRGYVILPNKTKDLQESCWHFLNWSCWRDTKPVWVHSPLAYCNSDIIFKRDDDASYNAARFIGWKEHRTLEEAIRSFHPLEIRERV